MVSKFLMVELVLNWGGANNGPQKQHQPAAPLSTSPTKPSSQQLLLSASLSKVTTLLTTTTPLLSSSIITAAQSMNLC